MRILIISDAWRPQVNGVVRVLERTVECLGAMGHDAQVVGPDRFRSVPCPTYPEIRLALFAGVGVGRVIADMAPDAIHITTEGPLGLAARRACLKHGLGFTTSFHTRFPEYVEARLHVPPEWGYAYIRHFHNAARAMMVTNERLGRELANRGFRNIKLWRRGVDTRRFRPEAGGDLGLPRPIFLYVGRIAVEKNLEAFLGADLPGSKLVVGDGPARAALAAAYPQARFVGTKEGEALAAHYAGADAFVFPSRTDTFGMVLLEALASGVPVAAYPVPGPLDVVGGSDVAVLDADLRAAALRALEIPRARCRAYALGYSWANATKDFVANLHPITRARQAA